MIQKFPFGVYANFFLLKEFLKLSNFIKMFAWFKALTLKGLVLVCILWWYWGGGCLSKREDSESKPCNYGMTQSCSVTCVLELNQDPMEMTSALSEIITLKDLSWHLHSCVLIVQLHAEDKVPSAWTLQEYNQITPNPQKRIARGNEVSISEE